MKSLGKRPAGARLERIQASPRWAGDRFRNVHPIAAGLRDPTASMPSLGDFLCGGERRVPRGHRPRDSPALSDFSPCPFLFAPCRPLIWSLCLMITMITSTTRPSATGSGHSIW
jgi:hypothetical protein